MLPVASRLPKGRCVLSGEVGRDQYRQLNTVARD